MNYTMDGTINVDGIIIVIIIIMERRGKFVTNGGVA